MDYTELSDLYSRNMFGAGDFDTYHGEAELVGGRRKSKRQQLGGRKQYYDPEGYNKTYSASDEALAAGYLDSAYDQQFGAGYRYAHDYDQYGGADFTEAECRQWLADNFTNPKTGRKIGPTKNGKGVYYDLQQACLGYANSSSSSTSTRKASTSGTSSSTALTASTSSTSSYVMQAPPPVQAQPIRRTAAGEEIIRRDASRKAPAASATSLPVGTKRVGGDGQMYIVKLRANSTQYWQPCSQSTANC